MTTSTTFWRICRRCGRRRPANTGRARRILASAALAVAQAAAALGQSVPAELLRAPTVDSWPTYHGDYSGQHHSRLTEITPDNVHRMTLAWAFQTNVAPPIKATPILVNGVIYLTSPDNLWAIDARSGRQIWRYSHPANEGFKIGHRGAAVRGDLVYLTTPDAHASIVNGYNAQRREVIFTESWSELARNRRMRFEELERTSYLAYYPRL